MKAVLISTQPKWCEKICHEIGTDKNGQPIYEKSIEVRKTKPSIPTPFKCYIYCTKTKNNWSLCAYEGAYENSESEIVYAQQRVIGEFICDKVEKFEEHIEEGGLYYTLRNDFNQATQLDNWELHDYGKGKTLYGWHITDLKIYDKPKELKDFLLPCGGKICWGCNLLNVKEADCINRGKRYATRPPQSWVYVQELEDEK